MPYRHAWLFVVALIAATVFAFWSSYFGILRRAPVGFHLHGVTASLWLLLLLAQSWTPHRGRMAIHRALGKLTFVAVPLLAAGSMGVIHSMATATAAGDLFYAPWGAPLGFIDLLAFFALLVAAALALRHRRSVRLHSGYMLSTALPLVSPVLGRVFNQTIPPIMIRGPQDFPLFGYGVQLANLVAGAIAWWAWRRDPSAGAPWALMLAMVVAQVIGFEALTGAPGWRDAFVAWGTLPLPLLATLGLATGIAAVWAGWSMPARRGGHRAITA